MTLAEYLKLSGLSLSAFAARAAVSEAAISRYASGKRTPRPDILRRICEASNGKVTPNDFYSGKDEEALPTPSENYLSDYPDLCWVDLLIPDLSGLMRGKRIHAKALHKIFEEGIRMPASIFALNILGENVEGTGLLWRIGDADFPVWPADERIRPTPWSREPSAHLMMTMYEDSGAPHFADPRHALAQVLRRYHEDGLTPVVAPELEFFLLDREAVAEGRVEPPRYPGSPYRDDMNQVYGMAPLDAFADLMADIVRACELQGIPADCASTEYAPGQFEINLKHTSDVMQAADNAVLMKRTVKALAAQHGYEATFMAKPIAEDAGSGLHLHMSLLDEAGQNIFNSGDAPPNDAIRHAIGGMRAAMAECMAIFAPNANAFRRIRGRSYAPIAPSWGLNNRTVAFRIPGGPPIARRIEHRVAGADANIYLAMAAVLAAAHYGLTEKMDPGPMSKGNAYIEGEAPDIPMHWHQALARLEAGQILPRYIDPRAIKLYAATKRGEMAKFDGQITDIERRWYLRTL